MKLSDFVEFFAAVNDGHEPFSWQRRLCAQVVDEGRWPDQIAAPTGAGKSNVVDVHVFANALFAAGEGRRVPRRLITAVNRRALVDDLFLRAQAIQSKLEEAMALSGENDLLGRIGRALQSLVQRPDVHNPAQFWYGDPLTVVSLRGGVHPNAEWLVDPRGCAVIAATPDMVGSRLLFRGYGASPMARPREAGLLAYDTVMVLDEAHLNRQLLHTSRTIATEVGSFTAFGETPPLQVCETSATPGAELDSTVGVQLEDLVGKGADAALVARLTRPKHLTIHRSSNWPRGKPTVAYVREICDLAQSLRARTDGTTVGCIVNNVATAISVSAELRSRLRAQEGEVVTWVGRMRPMDLEKLRRERPGLFTVAGDPGVAFLVATQTVEVGVDIDLGGLVTELSSGTAMTQRAGRVNRLGLRESAEIVVIAPEEVVGDRLPYREEDLRQCLAWLERRVEEGIGMAPWELVQSPAGPEQPRRLVLSTLTCPDRDLLAQTTTPLFSEPDLTFWLRDDLEVETEPVNIVVRSTLPRDDADAVSILRITEIDPSECFPATIKDARSICGRVASCDNPEMRRGFLLHESEWVVFTGDPPRLSPGDTVVLDTGHRITTGGVIDPDAEHTERHQVLWGPPQPDALGDTGWVILAEQATDADREVLIAAAEADSQESRAELATLAAALLPGPDVDLSVEFPAVPPGEVPQWAVISTLTADVKDAEIRQEFSASPFAVPLAGHQAAVAILAERMARDLGLADPLIEGLRLAGLHHDDGKAHPDFQVRLGAKIDQPLLAKSGHTHPQERHLAVKRSSLPPSWRHEQLSVVMASRLDLSAERDIVLRLIGTSHGRGRPFFPHACNFIPEHEDGAAEAWSFFVDSEWSDVLERTEQRFGAWGTAYLEAVLRSADCLVSSDGS